MAWSWRQYTDWAKQRPAMLRVADALGRGRGRLRLFDDINPPAKPAFVPNLKHWENHELAALWIGHATVLLRIGEKTILTDPVMSSRIGIDLGLITCGPRRFFAPALSVRKLPKLDLLLISHAHFDHLDRPTLSRLPKTVPVVTAHQTQDLIRDLGFRDVTELRWGESRALGGLTLTARQCRHWGARTFYDSYRGFNAYLLEAGKRRVLYGGDTAYFDGFNDILGVDLAILGIGAYDPYVAAHATPEQAWKMADHCRAERVMAMHHSTFRLSHEPVGEPIERFLSAAGGLVDRVVNTQIGASWSLS